MWPEASVSAVSSPDEIVSNLEGILTKLVGASVSRPRGTLAGHAAGLPFEESVQAILEVDHRDVVIRHHEALNAVLNSAPEARSAEERTKLLGTPATQELLKRGRAAMVGWSPDHLFAVKQNDTFESLIVPEPIALNVGLGRFVGLDVKTTNLGTNGQPPNIISAGKLSEIAKMILEEGAEPQFDIVYVGVGWRVTPKTLDAETVRVISLFKIPPDLLYINWVAAQQIQFHPSLVAQDFDGSRLEWCLAFLRHFCESLRNRIGKDQQRAEQFEAVVRQYLEREGN